MTVGQPFDASEITMRPQVGNRTPEAPLAKLSHVGRFSSASRPALVLSGGGLLGAVQVGILKVLFAAGLQPSMVVGTSVGALNGAFVAFRPDASGPVQLEAVWRDLRASRVFERNPLRVAGNLLGRGNCVFSNDPLQHLVRLHLAEDDFRAASLPLYITATNLSKGEKVVLKEGVVSRAVVASAAIPGLFCPVEIDGERLVDGALMANLDIETAVSMGATEVLAIDLSQPTASFRSRSMLDVLNRSIDVLLREQSRRDIERFADRANVTVIRPRLEHAHSLASFGHIPHLVAEGERLGQQLLAGCLGANGRLTCSVVE